jgi:excisionase family DNA binding protein
MVRSMTDMSSPERSAWVDSRALARHLSVPRSTVYNLLKAGMPSLKLGRSRRFNIEAVEAWLIERNPIADRYYGSGDAA